MKTILYRFYIWILTLFIFSSFSYASDESLLSGIFKSIQKKISHTYGIVKNELNGFHGNGNQCEVNLNFCFGSKKNTDTELNSTGFSILEMLASGCEGTLYYKRIITDKNKQIISTFIFNEKIKYSYDVTYDQVVMNVEKKHLFYESGYGAENNDYIKYIRSTPLRWGKGREKFPKISIGQVYHDGELKPDLSLDEHLNFNLTTYTVKQNKEKKLTIGIIAKSKRTEHSNETVSTESHLVCTAKTLQELRDFHELHIERKI